MEIEEVTETKKDTDTEKDVNSQPLTAQMLKKVSNANKDSIADNRTESTLKLKIA